jgi:hypothetical protein
MALEKLTRSGTWGIAFIVSYGIVCEIVAKACSSPQTAELNAHKRAPTLMKWVNIGMVESAGVVAAAAYFDRPHASPILWGGIAGGLVTYGQYVYAKQCGLNSDEPGTEDW